MPGSRNRQFEAIDAYRVGHALERRVARVVEKRAHVLGLGGEDGRRIGRGRNLRARARLSGTGTRTFRDRACYGTWRRGGRGFESRGVVTSASQSSRVPLGLWKKAASW